MSAVFLMLLAAVVFNAFTGKKIGDCIDGGSGAFLFLVAIVLDVARLIAWIRAFK